MTIELVEVTMDNLIEVISDKNMYAVVTDTFWNKNKPEIKPLDKIDLETLMSTKQVLRITID